MKKSYIFFNLLFLISYALFGQYYVSPSGSPSNNGLTEANAWSIEHAFNTAVSGDVVYVKAGLYFDNNITQNNNGTSVAPIKFIGYNNTINDINPDAQKSYTLGPKTINVLDSFEYGDVVDSTVMPLIKENRAPTNEGEGVAIIINGDYVELYNMQTQYYETGIRWTGNQGKYSNIIVTDCGDFNPNHQDAFDPPETNNYSGFGIYQYGDNAEIKNIYIENCGAQGFTLISDNNTIDAVTVTADTSVNACDYYFLLSGSTNNTCTNINVKRVGNLVHFGHGIVFKTPNQCFNNSVSDFIVDNTNLELQFPGVHDNIASNGYVIRQAVTTNVDAAGINLANGSHTNTFNNIYLENCSIFFKDWDDGATGDVSDASDNNIFNQITIDGGHSAIAFSHAQWMRGTSSADNNTFYNCTFSGTNWQYETSRVNSNSQFINCIWDGMYLFGDKRSDGIVYSVDASYTNNNFWNLSYSAPSGTNITGFNPLFTDAVNGDFSLQSTSPIKGIGIATPFLPAGNDLGAVQSSSGVSVTSISVSPGVLSLIIGENASLVATVTPTNATDQNITWSSNNNSVATVDQNGSVTAMAIGNVTITATTSDGGFTASSMVNVIDVVCNSPSANTGINPVQISVSNHDGNIPCNTMDNDLNTRWSSLGDGQWIQFDLGSQVMFNQLQVAFYLGDVRSSMFDIQVSNDASTWTTVLLNQNSSASTLQLEDFNMPEQNARYIRYIGHGNTNSLWNSLAEVRINMDTSLSVSNYHLESAISLYPNPSSNQVKISLDNVIGTEYLLYSISGAIIKKDSIDNTERDLILNVSNLETGVYIIGIVDEKGKKIFRKIVKK